jgi:uncharacterized RDD family membrane protein YckC
MTCQYCTAKNDPEDHRCQRCGRRIHSASERSSFDRTPVSTSSLAPALSFEPVARESRHDAPPRPAFGPQIVPPQAAPAVHHGVHQNHEQREERRSAGYQTGYQASLFGPLEVKKTPTEVPRRPAQTSSRPRADKSAQQSLDFIGPVPHANHALKTSVEARIYCNAPIADMPLRIMAAVADCGVPLIGVALFAATFHFMGQELVFTSQMMLSYLAITIVISLLYRVLFCLGNGDTAGLQWLGLRVLDFDGRVPTRKQRFQRLAGGCVGVLAVGLGLLWSLFDEERLTWHDHMSQTFPTSRR